MTQALRLLAVVTDVDALHGLGWVAREEGDLLETTEGAEEAIAKASIASFEVAFVELGALGDSAVALCHHLLTLCHGIAVHVLARPSELERAAEALMLGAKSVMLMPLTGEAVQRALADAKEAERGRERIRGLEEKLAHERRRVETYERLVRFARGAAQSDAVKAIVDGLQTLSRARGVALYASFGGDDDRERVRLGAVGSALDLAAAPRPSELADACADRGARLLPLSSPSGEIGLLVLEGLPAHTDGELGSFSDLAAAMLTLVDRKEVVDESVRVFPPRHFGSVAERLLTLAKRHDRRASVLAIAVPPGTSSARRDELTLEIADVIRNTDALCGSEDGVLLLFLPETDGLGGHACRRRILAKLSGDRRSRPAFVGSAATPSDAPSVAVGIASFPHDGGTLKRLVRTARMRAFEDARSPVYALSLDALGLPDVVDTLIARPMFDAGPRSPFPLDVASSALFSLVSRACREAQRGGEIQILTTLQTGLGVAAAARQVGAPRVLDLRNHVRCENLEAIVVEAEHGAWVLCGRVEHARFRGVHAADPRLADVVGQRLLAMGSAHAG